MNRHFKLIDTAGLTRTATKSVRLSAKSDHNKMKVIDSYGKIKRKIPGLGMVNSEEDPSQTSKVISDLSVHSALNALRYSQVVVLTIEGKQGNFTSTDMKLANKCQKEGRAMIICANKRDLVALEGVSARQYELGVRAHCEAFLRDFGEIPIVSTAATCSTMDESFGDDKKYSSAIQNYYENSSISFDSVHCPEGIDRLMRAVVRTHDAWSKRIETATLNNWLNDLHVNTAPPRINGKETRIKFITQVKARPPSFILFSNCQTVPAAYSRFIRKRLQKDFNFNGVPLRFTIKKSKGKVADKSLFSRSKNNSVRSAGESRPVGKARDNRYLEIQRKFTQVERRRRSAKMRKTRKQNSRTPGKH
jgi:predicted GTPase